MREILFRGKRFDNGEWVEGYYYKRYMCPDNMVDAIQVYDGSYFETVEYHPVIPETLGQYTGLKDKNGKRIFEGDIVRCASGRICEIVYFVSRGCAQFDLNPISGFDMPPPKKSDLFSGSEVIGNIHDNPELIAEAHDD